MRMLLFGPGYVGARAAAAFERAGAAVKRIGRDTPPAEIRTEFAAATHILSTVAPDPEGDPILAAYGAEIAGTSAWLGYLSSTGVYGDSAGGWVDETAPLTGRRPERTAADRAWLALGARVFRLPGIYGPERSMLDRVGQGRAHRIDLPGQVFSRIHVDDIVAALVVAAERGPAGAYNIADDRPAPQNDLVAEACALLGRPLPPLLSLAEADLSPAARAFYAENRRIASGKAKRLLGWMPRYPDYRAGLRALIAMTSPTIASAAPAAAIGDQR